MPCRLSLWFGLACLLLSAGCAPSVTPLYRDYEIRTPAAEGRTSPDGDTYARLRAALHEAGWAETVADAPNVLSTEPRTLPGWGFSRTEVSLDLAPLNDRFVRVYFNPYRFGLFGGRSKVPYLSGGLRRALLPDLNKALEAQGFVVLGTPQERDEETVDG